MGLYVPRSLGDSSSSDTPITTSTTLGEAGILFLIVAAIAVYFVAGIKRR